MILTGDHKGFNMLLASLIIGAAVMSTSGPNPSETSFGSWLAHNEQGGRSPWKPVASDFFAAQAWVGSVTETIDFYDFGFDVQPNQNYSVTFGIDYQCKPDANPVYGHLVTLGAVRYHDDTKDSEQILDGMAIEVTSGTDWATIASTQIIVSGSGLLADPTLSFAAVQATDLNATILVKVRVLSCVPSN